jgi:hypothetical protein
METKRGNQPVSNRAVGPAPATMIGMGRMSPAGLHGGCPRIEALQTARIASLRTSQPLSGERYAARPRGPPLPPRQRLPRAPHKSGAADAPTSTAPEEHQTREEVLVLNTASNLTRHRGDCLALVPVVRHIRTTGTAGPPGGRRCRTSLATCARVGVSHSRQRLSVPGVTQCPSHPLSRKTTRQS